MNQSKACQITKKVKTQSLYKYNPINMFIKHIGATISSITSIGVKILQYGFNVSQNLTSAVTTSPQKTD